MVGSSGGGSRVSSFLPGQFSGNTCHVDVPHLLVEAGGYILNGLECPVQLMLTGHAVSLKATETVLECVAYIVILLEQN